MSTPIAATPDLRRGKLFEQCVIVDAARQGASIIAEKLRLLQADFDATHADLVRLVVQSRGLVAVEEAELRRLAIAAYEQTGDKSPAPGVGIRITKSLAYDTGRALTWARQFGLALTVDAKAFERIATASPIQPGDPLDFVTVKDEAVATIARDLHAAIAEGT